MSKVPAPPRPGTELAPDGHPIGRDPRTMTQDELRDVGHAPRSAIDALRARCLDCCAGSSDEVKKCMALSCPAWPFRLGRSPWRAPVSEARREQGRRLAASRAAAARG